MPGGCGGSPAASPGGGAALGGCAGGEVGGGGGTEQRSAGLPWVILSAMSLLCFKQSNPQTNPNAAHDNREVIAVWKRVYWKRGKLPLPVEKVVGGLKTWGFRVLLLLFGFWFLFPPAVCK